MREFMRVALGNSHISSREKGFIYSWDVDGQTYECRFARGQVVGDIIATPIEG
jgi:hypothetical protein